MNHQDFTQVILRKPKENGEIVLKYNAGKNRKTSDESMKKIENEEIKLATSTDEIRKGMNKARTEKKLTQEQLAILCSLPKQTIRDYENGKAIVKLPELQIINKVLGTSLLKPKAIKILI